MKRHAKFFPILLLLFAVQTIVSSQEMPTATSLAETSWTTQTSGTGTSLYAVDAVGENVAWIGGGTGAGTTGIILRTTNGGTTWLNAGNLIGDVYAITGVDGNTAVAAMYTSAYAKLVRTTNSGTAWQTTDSIVGGFYDNVTMFDATTGYVIGDPTPAGTNWVLRRTTNGGATWTTAATLPAGNATEAGWNNNFAWYDNTYGWFGTNNSRIYRTTNGGSTWSRSSIPFLIASSLYFTTPFLGLVGSDIGHLIRTTDGGVTWTALPSAPTSIVQSISGVRGTQDFWVISGTGMAFTSNAGDSWTTSGPNVYAGPCALTSVSMVSAGANVFGWGCGRSGCIARYRRIMTEINERGADHPSHFRLDQNYPNPFNPRTTISFSLPSRSRVSLKVFDPLGREVATLLDRSIEVGSYSVDWNASSSASGVYLYQIRASGRVETKKMLLAK